MNQVPLINKPSGDCYVFGIPSRNILSKSQEVVTPIEVTATAMETVPAAHRRGQCYPVADLEPLLSICFCYLPRDLVAKDVGQGDGVMSVVKSSQIRATDSTGTHPQNNPPRWTRGALSLTNFQMAQRLQKGRFHIVLAILLKMGDTVVVSQPRVGLR